MPKFPIISGKEMMLYLGRQGFIHSRSKGSHRVYIKIVSGGKLITVIPDHKELDIKTLKSILKQSHITEEEFLKVR